MNTETKMWCDEQVQLNIVHTLRVAQLSDAQKCKIIWSRPYETALASYRNGKLRHPQVYAAYNELKDKEKEVFDEYIRRTLVDIKELCDNLQYIGFIDALPELEDDNPYNFYRILQLNNSSLYANIYGLLMEGYVEHDSDTNERILVVTPLAYYWHLDTHSSNSFRMSVQLYKVKYSRARVIAMFKHGLRTLSGKEDNPHNDTRVVDHLIYIPRFKIFDEYTRLISRRTNTIAYARDEQENAELGVTYNTKEVETLPDWITRPSP